MYSFFKPTYFYYVPKYYIHHRNPDSRMEFCTFLVWGRAGWTIFPVRMERFSKPKVKAVVCFTDGSENSTCFLRIQRPALRTMFLAVVFCCCFNWMLCTITLTLLWALHMLTFATVSWIQAFSSRDLWPLFYALVLLLMLCDYRGINCINVLKCDLFLF